MSVSPALELHFPSFVKKNTVAMRMNHCLKLVFTIMLGATYVRSAPALTTPPPDPGQSGFLYYYKLYIRFRFVLGAESVLESVSQSRLYYL